MICFWVETVATAGSSSFDGSEPLPRGEGFKEVVCRMSGVRDYGCGFVKSEGDVDRLNEGGFQPVVLYLNNPFKHVLVVNTNTSTPHRDGEC